MKVVGKVNAGKVKQINAQSIEALLKTADALKTDLVQSQTIPFGKSDKEKGYQGGSLQKSAFVDDSQSHTGKVSVVFDTPYARRLYFHPEYNFYKGENPNAGGMWFEPYINGDKKDFVKNTFKTFMKG